MNNMDRYSDGYEPTPYKKKAKHKKAKHKKASKGCPSVGGKHVYAVILVEDRTTPVWFPEDKLPNLYIHRLGPLCVFCRKRHRSAWTFGADLSRFEELGPIRKTWAHSIYNIPQEAIDPLLEK